MPAVKAAGVWVPRRPQDPPPPCEIPETRAIYFLEERYPEIRKPCAVRHRHLRNLQGVRPRRPQRLRPTACASISTSGHLPRDLLDRKLAGILEIYEKFQRRRSADRADEDLPCGPLFDGRTMGATTRDNAERRARSGLAAEPANEYSGGLWAIGECDYQFHGANWLGASCLVACLFSGLTVAPGIARLLG